MEVTNLLDEYNLKLISNFDEEKINKALALEVVKFNLKLGGHEDKKMINFLKNDTKEISKLQKELEKKIKLSYKKESIKFDKYVSLKKDDGKNPAFVLVEKN